MAAPNLHAREVPKFIEPELAIDNKLVDHQNITMPLLNFYCKYDHLVPPEACNLFTEKVGSTNKKDIRFNTGQIGINVSSKHQREFAPKSPAGSLQEIADCL